MGKKTLLSLLRRRLKNRSKRVKIVFSGVSDTILGKRIPFLCQTNLSLSLSLCGLLSFHRSDTARCVHDREHVSNVSRCSRGEENTGGVFSRVSAIAFAPSLLLAARSISIVIGTGRLRDRTIENLASGCTRISRFTAPPTPTPSCFPCVPVDVAASVCPRRLPDARDIPPILFAYVYIYVMYIRMCIRTPLRIGYVARRALMYHLRRWTRIYIYIYTHVQCMDAETRTCIRARVSMGIRLRQGKARPSSVSCACLLCSPRHVSN